MSRSVTHPVTSYLTGVTAVGASVIVIASAVGSPADITVPAGQATAAPGLSQQMVDLLAVAQLLAPFAAPAGSPPGAPPTSTLPFGAPPASVAPGTLAPAATAFALPPIGALVALADAVDNTYNVVEPALRWMVEGPRNLLKPIPVVGWLAWQPVVVYNFVESMVQSVIFNTTDWLRGEGGIIDNIVDVGQDFVAAMMYVVIDEVAAVAGQYPGPIITPRPPMDQSATSGLAADVVGPATVDHRSSPPADPSGGPSAVSDGPEASSGTEPKPQAPNPREAGPDSPSDSSDAAEEAVEDEAGDTPGAAGLPTTDPDQTTEDADQMPDETLPGADDEDTDDTNTDTPNQTQAPDTSAATGPDTEADRGGEAGAAGAP